MDKQPNEQLSFDFSNDSQKDVGRSSFARGGELTLVHSRSNTMVSKSHVIQREMILSNIISYARKLSW